MAKRTKDEKIGALQNDVRCIEDMLDGLDDRVDQLEWARVQVNDKPDLSGCLLCNNGRRWMASSNCPACGGKTGWSNNGEHTCGTN